MSFLILDLTSKRRETWYLVSSELLFISLLPHPRILYQRVSQKMWDRSQNPHCSAYIALPISKTFSRKRFLILPKSYFSVCLNYIAKYFSGILPTIVPVDFLFCTNFIILPDIERKWLCIYLGFKIFKAL